MSRSLETLFLCSTSSATGYFNAYGNAARKDEHDWVIHLGDYIYEYSNTKSERASIPPNEIFTLYDYRSRHGQVCDIHPLCWALLILT